MLWPTTAELSAWALDVSIYYVTMLLLWFTIHIMGLFLLFYLVYMGGSHGWGPWWIG